jgi:hypothetical protein
MTEAQAIQMLATQPLEFLRKNSLTPYAAGGAGVQTYYMVDTGAVIQRPGSRLGNLNTHAGQRFQARPNGAMGGHPFQALHIPVQPSNIAINAFPLHTVGTNLMITTQLTGCCIVMVPGAGTYSVAHLQPTGETGVQLRQRLAAQKIKVYGATDYAPGRGVLVGVRSGGQWSFYTQTQDAHFNVTGVKQLRA